MTPRIRVGTRRSPLALIQTDLVLRRLGRRRRSVRTEIVPLTPTGDRDRRPGGSPDFTDTLDRAVLDGTVDLAVHSAKDLPVRLRRGLALVACPVRADPRDVLVFGGAGDRRPLGPGARIGSSSPRRRAQLLRWDPRLTVVEIRGNVGTRLDRARRGEFDALVLAKAGLVRLGERGAIARTLPTASFLPSPGQGTLAVVARASSEDEARLMRTIDDPVIHACTVAEREAAAALGSNCRLPVAALATANGRTVRLSVEALSPDGRRTLRVYREAPIDRARNLGRRLGLALRGAGATRLLRSGPGGASP